MEKVKVTREVARAIKLAVADYGSDRVMDRVKGQWATDRLTPLNKLSPCELARALYIGYEVEPEFKVGDWVTDRDESSNVTGRITRVDTVNRLVWGYFSYHDKETNFDFWEVRHATPSEIAQEKERRFWKKHGREVWELKNGDVLVCDDYLRTVNKVVDFEEKTVIFSDKDWEYYENVIEEYEVVCFAENRLDVSKEDE